MGRGETETLSDAELLLSPPGRAASAPPRSLASKLELSQVLAKTATQGRGPLVSWLVHNQAALVGAIPYELRLESELAEIEPVFLGVFIASGAPRELPASQAVSWLLLNRKLSEQITADEMSRAIAMSRLTSLAPGSLGEENQWICDSLIGESVYRESDDLAIGIWMEAFARTTPTDPDLDLWTKGLADELLSGCGGGEWGDCDSLLELAREMEEAVGIELVEPARVGFSSCLRDALSPDRLRAAQDLREVVEIEWARAAGAGALGVPRKIAEAAGAREPDRVELISPSKKISVMTRLLRPGPEGVSERLTIAALDLGYRI